MAKQRQIMLVQLALLEHGIKPTRSQVIYRLGQGMKPSEVILHFRKTNQSKSIQEQTK
jgi:hypothetical protein